MTSRERVLQAIAHQPTDRTPADFGAIPAVTDALIRKLGVADAEELLVALGVDMRRIWFNYGQPDTAPDAEGYRQTMWGARHRPGDPADGRPNFISPFNEDTTVEQVHAHVWPDAAQLDYSGVREQCRKHHGKYATFGAPWSPFFHEVGWLVGQEEFMMWMHTKPEVIRAIIDHVVDYEGSHAEVFPGGGRPAGHRLLRQRLRHPARDVYLPRDVERFLPATAETLF